jgi:hypothetical protein
MERDCLMCINNRNSIYTSQWVAIGVQDMIVPVETHDGDDDGDDDGFTMDQNQGFINLDEYEDITPANIDNEATRARVEQEGIEIEWADEVARANLITWAMDSDIDPDVIHGLLGNARTGELAEIRNARAMFNTQELPNNPPRSTRHRDDADSDNDHPPRVIRRRLDTPHEVGTN